MRSLLLIWRGNAREKATATDVGQWTRQQEENIDFFNTSFFINFL